MGLHATQSSKQTASSASLAVEPTNNPTSHLAFNYNYGQFFTLWDRIGGTYRRPNDELFNRVEKSSAKELERQAKEADSKIQEAEGEDDREYMDIALESRAKKLQ